VRAKPLRGLHTDVETLAKLCRGDKEAEDALDEAMQRPAGRPAETHDNVQGLSAPTGNSRQQALRKLRTEARASPRVAAVYKRVLAGEISPHRGMVECGFRKEPTLRRPRCLAWGKRSRRRGGNQP
jgi:hypothetical protein